ncbi:MAG: S8 family serine peptidase, partial [Bacteroidota bacterium]
MKRTLHWQNISGLRHFSLFLLALVTLALLQSCNTQEQQNQIALEQAQEVSIAPYENQEQTTEKTLSLAQEAVATALIDKATDVSLEKASNTSDKQGFSFTAIRNSLSNFFFVKIGGSLRSLWSKEVDREESILHANSTEAISTVANLDSIPKSALRLIDPKLHFLLEPNMAQQKSTPLIEKNDLTINDEKVLVEVIAENNKEEVLKVLNELGIQEQTAAGRIISTWLLPKELYLLANREEIHWIRPVLKSSSNGGLGQTQTTALASDGFNTIMTNCGLDGSGVKVGVISTSYNTLNGESAGIASGDLPGTGNPNGYTTPVVVLEEPTFTSNDEARAMIEIIHELAPGATFSTHTGFGGQANYAQGVQDLVNDGVDIIATDFFYVDAPFFQDGVVSQAFEDAITAGIPVIQHAGNFETNSYESPFVNSGQTYNGEVAHDFDPGPGVDIRQTITIDLNSSFFISLQWDDPWFSVSGVPGADTDLNIYMINPNNVQVFSQETDNITSGDPLESFNWNNGNLFTTYEIIITKAAGADPGLIKYLMTNPEVSGIGEYATNSPTIVGTQSSENLISVGGTVQSDPNTLYIFSSEGQSAILFDENGNSINSPVARDFPTIVAPQAVNTTFFGLTGVDDLENDGFPNFWGTSASSPHVAGLAALIYECNTGITPAQLKQTLIDNAVDINTPGYDTKTGYGYWAPEATISAACPSLDCTPPSCVTSYATAAEGDINDRGDNQSGPVTNAVGAPDGNSTEIGASNDYVVLTLADELPAGTQYTLYIGGRGGSATAEIWEAPDGTTLPGSQQNSPAGFTQNGTASSSGAITMVTKTAGVATKFIYLQRGSGDILVDAVEYCLVTCQPTDVTAMANQATCSGTPPSATANMDASIVLSTVTDGDRYHIVSDGDFTGLNAANATLLSTIGGSAPYTLLSGLANPSGSVTYTIRVFNGNDDACATDVSVTLNPVNCNQIQTCECTEYVYVNDEDLDVTHKFEVNPTTGGLTEIFSTGTTPWLTGIMDPHSVAQDINGNIYIGNRTGADNDFGNMGNIRKFNCDGDEDVTTNGLSGITSFHFNFQSRNGLLYQPRQEVNATGQEPEVFAYDLCDGSVVGSMQIHPSDNLTRGFWGFAVTDTDWYAAGRNGVIYRGSLDPSMYTTPFTPANAGQALFDTDNSGSRGGPTTDPGLMGIDVDEDGNIYVIINDFTGTEDPAVIRKYSPTGTLLAEVSAPTGTANTMNGEQGFSGSRGIVYSESSGLLYVGNFENCLTVFDPTPVANPMGGTDILPELTTLNIGNPSGGDPKGVAIATECCPAPGTSTINRNLCIGDFAVNDVIFLTDLSGCNGAICDGNWTPQGMLTDITFEPCNNSITITGPAPCGTFLLSGGGAGQQCAPFSITVEICVAAPPTSDTPTSTSGTCTNDIPNNDASISIANIMNADVVGVSSAGATEYDGSPYDAAATASDLFLVTGGTATITGLEHDADYIVRLFNQGSGCSDDLLNIMTPMIDCDDVILGAIGNYVWIDEDSDGFQDEGEPGIPNVAVVLYGDPDGDGTVEALDTT